MAWTIVRQGRRDKIEAALLAGCSRCSCTACRLRPGDQGRPASVRGHARDDARSMKSTTDETRSRAGGRLAVACVGLVIGIALARPRERGRLRRLDETPADGGGEESAAASRAGDASDRLFYALAYARLEPLRPPQGGPRRVCTPSTARSRLCAALRGRSRRGRAQPLGAGSPAAGLVEWRTAVELRPATVLADQSASCSRREPRRKSSRPLGATDPTRMLGVVRFLARTARFDEALAVLDQAGSALGADERACSRRVNWSSGQLVAAGRPRWLGRTPRASWIRGCRCSRPRRACDQGGGQAPTRRWRPRPGGDADPLDLRCSARGSRSSPTIEKWQPVDRRRRRSQAGALPSDWGDSFDANDLAARIRVRLGQWNLALRRISERAVTGLPASVALGRVRSGRRALRPGRDGEGRLRRSRAPRAHGRHDHRGAPSDSTRTRTSCGGSRMWIRRRNACTLNDGRRGVRLQAARSYRLRRGNRMVRIAHGVHLLRGPRAQVFARGSRPSPSIWRRMASFSSGTSCSGPTRPFGTSGSIGGSAWPGWPRWPGRRSRS